MDAEPAPAGRLATAHSLRADSGDVEQQMSNLIYGYAVSQTVRAIADHLSDGGLTATDIAVREGSSLPTTLRLMRAGVALGLMTADAGGHFYGTDLLATLRKDASARPRASAMSPPSSRS